MIKHKDLVAMYWGEEGTPDQWNSIKEIATANNVTEDWVKAALKNYRIETRDKKTEAHKPIFEMLIDQYGFEPGKDFLYQTEVNRRPVTFWLVDGMVGINLDRTIPPHEVKIHYVHNTMIFLLGFSDMGRTIQTIIRELKTVNVKPKRVAPDDEEGEVW